MKTVRKTPVSFSLRAILATIAVVAVCMAWWLDHRRLSNMLDLRQRQIDQFQALSGLQTGKIVTIYNQADAGNWADAESFLREIELRDSTTDFTDFISYGSKLAGMQDPLFSDVMSGLLPRLEYGPEESQIAAMDVIRGIFAVAPERIDPYRADIIRVTLEWVKSDSPSLPGVGIHVLLEIRADQTSEGVKDSLTAVMNEDANWWAPAALLALAKMDKSLDLAGRALKLCDFHPHRLHLIPHLPELVGKSTASTFLEKLYSTAANDEEKEIIAYTMNKISSGEGITKE